MVLSQGTCNFSMDENPTVNRLSVQQPAGGQLPDQVSPGDTDADNDDIRGCAHIIPGIFYPELPCHNSLDQDYNHGGYR